MIPLWPRTLPRSLVGTLGFPNDDRSHHSTTECICHSTREWIRQSLPGDSGSVIPLLKKRSSSCPCHQHGVCDHALPSGLGDDVKGRAGYRATLLVALPDSSQAALALQTALGATAVLHISCPLR